MLNKSLLLATKPKPKIEYGGAHWSSVNSFYIADALDPNESGVYGEEVTNDEAINPWMPPTVKGPKIYSGPDAESYYEFAFTIFTDGYDFNMGENDFVPEGQGCFFTVYDTNGNLITEYEDCWVGEDTDEITFVFDVYDIPVLSGEVPVGEYTFNVKMRVGNKLVEATAIIDFQSPS